jgi:RNA polymerase sigma-70 factor (ECF subfamily)
MIDCFLDALDEHNRIMFVRRYWFSDSIANIAELFHTTDHNVVVRLSRTRTKLKKYLIKEGVLYEKR